MKLGKTMENEERHVSPQTIIEAEMQEIIASGNFEMAHLYSDEGLLLAEVSAPCPVARDNLIEIALHFQELRKITDIMDAILNINEIILEGESARKLVFRFFEAFEQTVILGLVIPPRKTYRKYTNGLVRLIKKVSA